jgi:hypothetical protein
MAGKVNQLPTISHFLVFAEGRPSLIEGGMLRAAAITER